MTFKNKYCDRKDNIKEYLFFKLAMVTDKDAMKNL